MTLPRMAPRSAWLRCLSPPWLPMAHDHTCAGGRLTHDLACLPWQITKDFILFAKGEFTGLVSVKDNTGQRSFDNYMAFPRLGLGLGYGYG